MTDTTFLEIGSQAPEFTLPGAGFDPVSLRDQYERHGGAVVVFLPLAFSPVCTEELCSVSSLSWPEETSPPAVLAVTCDSVFTQQAWSQQHQSSVTLVSDFWPHGEVSRAYGVFDQARGASLRATFRLDHNGVVVARQVSGIQQPRDLTELARLAQ